MLIHEGVFIEIAKWHLCHVRLCCAEFDERREERGSKASIRVNTLIGRLIDGTKSPIISLTEVDPEWICAVWANPGSDTSFDCVAP